MKLLRTTGDHRVQGPRCLPCHSCSQHSQPRRRVPGPMEATRTWQQAQHLPGLPGLPSEAWDTPQSLCLCATTDKPGTSKPGPVGCLWQLGAQVPGPSSTDCCRPQLPAALCAHSPCATHTPCNPTPREEPERPFGPGSASAGRPGHCDPRPSLSCAQKPASLANCWHLPSSRDAAQLPGAYMSPAGTTAQAPASGHGGCGQQRLRERLTAHRPAGTCRSRKVPAGPAAVSTRSSARPRPPNCSREQPPAARFKS